MNKIMILAIIGMIAVMLFLVVIVIYIYTAIPEPCIETEFIICNSITNDLSNQQP